MEYLLKSAKLQDLLNKTIKIIAPASTLGSIETVQTGVDEEEEPIYADVLTISLEDVSEQALTAADIYVATDITEAAELTVEVSESGDSLELTGDTIGASDLIKLVIKLK